MAKGGKTEPAQCRALDLGKTASSVGAHFELGPLSSKFQITKTKGQISSNGQRGQNGARSVPRFGPWKNGEFSGRAFRAWPFVFKIPNHKTQGPNKLQGPKGAKRSPLSAALWTLEKRRVQWARISSLALCLQNSKSQNPRAK